MHSATLLVALTLFALAPFSPAYASSIDDFVLKGEGNTITFSLPSPTVGIPSVGAGGVIGGFYLSGPTSVLFNGNAQSDTLEFLSGALFYVGAGLILQSPGGQLVVVGPVLYSGGPYTPTFNLGGFNLKNYSNSNPYLLTITPEAATAPEPGSLVLLCTGLAGVMSRMRRGLRVSRR